MKNIIKTSLFIMLFVFIMPSIVKAEYTPDKQHSSMSAGDEIYLDLGDLNWEHVYIYIWADNGSGEYKSWPNADEMTKVSDEEKIYRYIVPNDIGDNKDMVIFKNGLGGDSNKSINLSYIKSKYAYKITTSSTTESQGGYWYLYDKDEFTSRVDEIMSYKDNKEYYTEASYGNYDTLVDTFQTQLNQELVLESEKDSNNHDTGKYYLDIDYTLYDIDQIISNLVLNKSLLEDLINVEKGKIDEYKNDYTEEYVNNYKDALDTLLNDIDSIDTVDKLKAEIEKVKKAKNKLVKKEVAKDESNKEVSEVKEETKKAVKAGDNIDLIIYSLIISMGLLFYKEKRYN